MILFRTRLRRELISDSEATTQRERIRSLCLSGCLATANQRTNTPFRDVRTYVRNLCVKVLARSKEEREMGERARARKYVQLSRQRRMYIHSRIDNNPNRV